MNEVLHCLLTRRSVKKYLSQPVEREKLDAVLEAGTYAACGMGRQAGRSSCCKTRTISRSWKK